MYEFYFTEWNFQSVKLISNWPFLCCEVSNILLTVQIIRVSTKHSRIEERIFLIIFLFHISSYIYEKGKRELKKFIFFCTYALL